MHFFKRVLKSQLTLQFYPLLAFCGANNFLENNRRLEQEVYIGGAGEGGRRKSNEVISVGDETPEDRKTLDFHSEYVVANPSLQGSACNFLKN